MKVLGCVVGQTCLKSRSQKNLNIQSELTVKLNNCLDA